MAEPNDPRAPMPAAPMVYRDDGGVDWGNMWDTFCALALDGGPTHRDEVNAISASTAVNPQHPTYAFAVAEICRGIFEVSGFHATAAEPGWIAVPCAFAGQAGWLAAAIEVEHVAAREQNGVLYVPVAETFTLKGEIKSVITVVAKTTHYWTEHLPPEVKRSLALQAKLGRVGTRIKRLFGGK